MYCWAWAARKRSGMMDKITLRYKGKSVVDGNIDARQLASSLIEFSKLLDMLNNELNEGEPLKIDVTTTKKGSFEIELLIGLFNPGTAPYWRDLFKNYKSIKEVVLELLELKKFLEGKPAKETKVDPNNEARQIVINGDNNIINIDQRTIDIAQNDGIGEALESFVNSSVSSQGVEQLDVVDHGNSKNVEILYKEAKYYQKPEPINNKEEVIGKRITEMALSIVSAVFNEEHKWKFRTSQGKTFTAHIEDESFKERYMEGRISFNVNDILNCEVHYTEYTTPEGGLRAKDYKISKVIDHISPLKQALLPL